MPSYYQLEINRLSRVSDQLEIGLGRPANRAELAEGMGKTAEAIEDLILHSSSALSLNCPIEWTDGDVELGDSIAGPEDTAEEGIKTMMGSAGQGGGGQLAGKAKTGYTA